MSLPTGVLGGDWSGSNPAVLTRALSRGESFPDEPLVRGQPAWRSGPPGSGYNTCLLELPPGFQPLARLRRQAGSGGGLLDSVAEQILRLTAELHSRKRHLGLLAPEGILFKPPSD